MLVTSQMDFGQESLNTYMGEFCYRIFRKALKMKEYSWKHLVICGQAMGSGYRIFENERVYLETLGHMWTSNGNFVIESLGKP